MKAYLTKRIGNDKRTYVGANINNRQFEVKVPTIKGTIKKIGDKIKQDNESREYESKKSQQEYEDEKTGRYRGGRSTSDGYMPKR